MNFFAQVVVLSLHTLQKTSSSRPTNLLWQLKSTDLSAVGRKARLCTSPELEERVQDTASQSRY